MSDIYNSKELCLMILMVNDMEGLMISSGIDNCQLIPFDSPQIKSVKMLLEDPAIRKYGHDLKQNIVSLSKRGISLKGADFDVMVASYLLDPSQSSHELEIIALKCIDRCSLTDRSPEWHCNVIWALKSRLDQDLQKHGLWDLFKNIEMPIVEILAEMEIAGILVDPERLKLTSQELALGIETSKKEISQIVGVEFNPFSDLDVKRVFVKNGILKKADDIDTITEETLENLSDKHPLVSKVLQYRKLKIAKSGIVDYCLQNADFQGRVHTSLEQARIVTGRIQSIKPCLQNLPKSAAWGIKIKEAFVANSGYILLAADYAQIESRIMAHCSEDENMVGDFIKGLDIHEEAAKMIYDVTNVLPNQRAVAKTINLGISYGMTDYGVAKKLHIPVNEAKGLIEKYCLRYQGVQLYKERVVRDARKNGYVKSMLGRIRYIPGLDSPIRRLAEIGERAAFNTVIQGTGADILKIAMINTSRFIKGHSYKTKILLPVHDELIFEVPGDELKAIAAGVKYHMENAVKLIVPLEVKLMVGLDLATMKGISIAQLNDKQFRIHYFIDSS